MFVLVAYEISSNRRRKKIAKVLSGFGDRVNLFVFECEFTDPKMLNTLKAEIKNIIKAKKDHVRYYMICKGCREKITVQGYGTIGEEKTVQFA
ncbi:MAG: CRISPR-associated endonuclease Cas2 [Thermodesulfobacteriota bacterium]|nr:CRISPR-associated endonuclease Cas2 [Thermodesulfobacteriota bacterium]